MVKNITIQIPVEANPIHTFGLPMSQPRCRMERSDSVDLVSGKKTEKIFTTGCIPSMGQMMPHSITIGRKLPMAM